MPAPRNRRSHIGLPLPLLDSATLGNPGRLQVYATPFATRRVVARLLRRAFTNGDPCCWDCLASGTRRVAVFIGEPSTSAFAATRYMNLRNSDD